MDGLDLTLDGYQKLAERYSRYPSPRSLAGVSYLIHGLTGEAGEIANKFKKALRDDNNPTEFLTEEHRNRIVDEIGDTLWYLAMLASELDATLSEVVAQNRAKLEARNPGGYGG